MNRGGLASVFLGMRTFAIDLARGMAAAGVLLSAAVHLDLWDLQDFRQIDTIGPLFMVNVVAGLVVGVAVVVWRHWLAPLAAAALIWRDRPENAI